MFLYNEKFVLRQEAPTGGGGLDADPLVSEIDEIINDLNSDTSIDDLPSFDVPTEEARQQLKILEGELKGFEGKEPLSGAEAEAKLQIESDASPLSKLAEMGKLENMDYSEFMTYSISERFQFITSKETNIMDIYNGTQTEFTVDYRYNNEINDEIYMNTTAGLNFPSFIQKVELVGPAGSEAIQYERRNGGLQAEFFSTDGLEERLTIHPGTKIKIVEPLSFEEMPDDQYRSTSDIMKARPPLDAEARRAAFAQLFGFSSDDMESLDPNTNSLLGSLNAREDTSAKESSIAMAFANAAKEIHETQLHSNIPEVSYTESINKNGEYTTYINDYPDEASFKNNNPTGISWFDASGGLAAGTHALFQRNGVEYSRGKERPDEEGDHYVAFASVEDGMKAYYLMLTSTPGFTVTEKLYKWVSGFHELTPEWEGRQKEYVNDILKTTNIKGTEKMGDLEKPQLVELMHAQIKKESGGYYQHIVKPNNHIEKQVFG